MAADGKAVRAEGGPPLRLRRLRVARAADLQPFFQRYGVAAGPASEDDPLRVHLILRAPTELELDLLASRAGGVRLHASWSATVPSSPRHEPGSGGVVEGGVAAALLSGEASGFEELAAGLARENSGAKLADSIRRALRPPRVTTWPLRTRRLELTRPLVMGIVNVTPDSFSDGGRYADAEAAVRHGRGLADAGADLLDVGGESTRPGAARVDAAEEQRRVVPVVEELAKTNVPVSVDTTRASVAARALDAGAEIVNDVSALRFDSDLAHVVGESRAGLVLMHMLGTPETMQRAPRYQDVTGEVLEFLAGALARAEAAGVSLERCAVDPGIGFGKRLRDNDELLYRLEELACLGRPVVVGPSRKSFLDPQRLRAASERLPETIAAACLAALGGARILRVHDVDECGRALALVARVESIATEPASDASPPEE